MKLLEVTEDRLKLPKLLRAGFKLGARFELSALRRIDVGRAVNRQPIHRAGDA